MTRSYEVIINRDEFLQSKELWNRLFEEISSPYNMEGFLDVLG
jgi:hypothetical protein